MQCPQPNTIYVPNKEDIFRDIDNLHKLKIINKANMISHGNGDIIRGIEIFFKDKKWNYFNITPKESLRYNKTAKRLYNLGYYKSYKVPCGQCEICKVEKSKTWATKGYCEGETWKNKCFITLTYNNEHLPYNRKLNKAELQSFWKRLRYHLYKNTKKAQLIHFDTEMEEIPWNPLRDYFDKRKRNKKPIRYINCGEYGPKTKRPHYHACIFNFIPDDLIRHHKDERGYWVMYSPKLTKIWGKGFVVVEECNAKTVAYVARYTTKKYARSEEEQKIMKEKKQNEFIGASSSGFIGCYYWEKHKEEIKRNKGILMKSNDHTFLAKIPKPMEELWKIENELEFADYKVEKEFIGRENWLKILSKTDLPEEEYIWNTYYEKKRKYEMLKRNKGDCIRL